MDRRDSNSLRVTISCNGGEGIRRAVAGTRGFAIDCALEAAPAARLAIIVEELVTNIAEHGGIAADGEVELTLARQGAAIAITLSDNGTPFDPRSAPSYQAIPERGGGAGIGLVRAWADIVDYRSDGGRNRLTLVMPLAG